MKTRVKWYRMRWRVVLMLAAAVVLSCGYVGWRFYNAVRVRAMGDGPAGPAIAVEPFEQRWHDGPVVFIILIVGTLVAFAALFTEALVRPPMLEDKPKRGLPPEEDDY